MEIDVKNLVESLFRWVHAAAGILWIGFLYFFNWVNAPFQGTLDAEAKRRVNPELLPRVLYFFRWGALWTWLTGLVLSSFVYYETRLFFERPQEQRWDAAAGIMVVLTFAAFAIYDPLMKAVKNAKAQAAVGFVAITLFALAARHWAGFGFRGVFIHVGMLFGTLMAANVWMRIWPNQRRILAAVKGGTPPDPAMVALAGQRSKHNTYMSVPLVFTMVSQHATWAASGDWSLPLVVAVGWVAVLALYRKSAKVAGA